MNPELQRIKIAEACGYYRDMKTGMWENNNPRMMRLVYSLPDYLHDLNAMHEAEKVLTRVQQMTYMRFLERGHMSISIQITWPACHATAAQRAEAFLRTIGVWEDEA